MQSVSLNSFSRAVDYVLVFFGNTCLARPFTSFGVICEYPLVHGILSRPFLGLFILVCHYTFVPITLVSGLHLP